MTDKTLLQALLDFQQEAIAIVKDSKANYGKYVSLPKLIEELQPALNRHGLLITQFPSQTIDGQPALTSILAHAESGETKEFTAPLLLAKLDPQANGSALTYMRRYSYAAITQVVIDEDDDGQKTVAPIQAPNPATQIRQEHFSGAIKATAIDEQTLTKLNFLPNDLGLPKDQAKAIWDQLWQQGIRRGKFDPNTKKWANTEISTSDIKTIVEMFGGAAGKTSDSIQAITMQLGGDLQVDTPTNVDDYSDAPFDDNETF